jgi:sugar-specific transcriptional regulator TrmB
MDKIIDYLKQLDLSEAEVRIYIRLLQSGPTSVRDLAQTVDIKRTTAYFYIDQLVEKGLIMKLVRGSKKYVAANEPENLKALVDEKLKKAKEIQTGFPTILNDLKVNLPKKANSENAEIKYFKGIQGIKKIYEEAVKANELRSYVKLEETGGIFPNNIDFFTQAFKNNKKLTIKELLYNSPLSKEQAPKLLAKNKRYFYKFMPLELNLTSGDVLIFTDTVAILSYQRDISGVVLHNEDYFNNSKELFDFIWKII